MLTDLIPRMQTLLRDEQAGAQVRTDLDPNTAILLVDVIEWAVRRRSIAEPAATGLFADALRQLRAASAGQPGFATPVMLGPYTAVMLTETVAWAADTHDLDGYLDALALLRSACAEHPEAAALLDEHGSA